MRSRLIGGIQRLGPAGWLVLGAAAAFLVSGSFASGAETRVRDLMVDRAASRVAEQVQGTLMQVVTREDLEPPYFSNKIEALGARLDGVVDPIRQSSVGLLRLNVIAPDGTVLYSDLPALRGRIRVPESPLFAEALQGRMGFQLTGLDVLRDSGVTLRDAAALEVFLPVVIGGEVVGVCEVYQEVGGLTAVPPVAWGVAMAGSLSLALGSVLVVAAIGLRRQQLERDHTLEALWASEERLREIATNVPDWIFELDGATRCTYSNPSVEHILGYSSDQVLGKPCLDFIHPEDRAAAAAALDRSAVAQDASTNLLARALARDGRTVWLECSVSPRVDHQGGIVGFLGVGRDVTERVMLEERLLRAQRLETAGRVAGQVAHDFNNLLAPMVGYPELIRMQLPADHPAAAYCDNMILAAQQMAEINEDLQALGRRGHFNQEPTDLNRLLTRSIEQLGDLPSTLQLDLRLAPDIPPVQGSAAQLQRLVTNLLTNAREATVDAGTITVVTENLYLDRPVVGHAEVPIGQYVRLRVSDTGPGIAPEIRARIFDPFFTTKTTDRRGSGLGLSVVEAIVEDHEGYLDLETEPGRGTTFSVYLRPSPVPISEEQQVELLPGIESVLIVDDDKIQRDVTSEMLASLGYRVDAVASGEEAVAYCRERPVDLLLLDMVIPPGIDGAETYQRVVDQRPGQRAILLSGFAETNRVRVAQALGAGRFLRKPVLLAVLSQAVRGELDR